MLGETPEAHDTDPGPGAPAWLGTPVGMCTLSTQAQWPKGPERCRQNVVGMQREGQVEAIRVGSMGEAASELAFEGLVEA